MFRNIRFYEIKNSSSISANRLEGHLNDRASRSCGQHELACEGWSKPLGRAGSSLVHEVNKRIMICLRREEKVLPRSILRELIDEKIYHISNVEGRSVGRKERAEIRDQVMHELLPRALTKASYTYAYIDLNSSLLIVNAASAKKADDFTSVLIKSYPDLELSLPKTSLPIQSAMTDWVLNRQALPPEFALEDGCEARAASSSEREASVIRCQHINLQSDEIRAHILSGMQVHKLALQWRGGISFVLQDDLSIRRLRYDSEITDQIDESSSDEVAKFDSDFTVMGAIHSELIRDLMKALG